MRFLPLSSAAESESRSNAASEAIDVGNDESQPLLAQPPSTAMASATPSPAAFGRYLLVLTGGQLCGLLFFLFLCSLAREHKLMLWVDIAGATLQTDFLFVFGAVIGTLAAMFWGLGIFIVSDLGCGNRVCFAAAAMTAATVVWSLLIRLSQEHGLEMSCTQRQRHGDLCGGESRPSGTGLGVWLWMPTGLLNVLWNTLAQPWSLLLRPSSPSTHDLETWKWRECVVGSAFWLAAVVCGLSAPTLSSCRLLEGQEYYGLWIVMLSMLVTAFATYAAFILTSEPVLALWEFVLSPLAHFWVILADEEGDQQSLRRKGSDSRSRIVQPLQVEDWLALVLCIWIVLRLTYIVAGTKWEQWSAKRKCEEGLRRALANPFRADLESGFGSTAKADVGACQAVPAVRESPPTALAEVPAAVVLTPGRLQSFHERHEALAEARRQGLCDLAGGEAALPTTLHLHIRRDNLLEDTWRAMVERPVTELLAPALSVTFEGEEGVDVGGLTRDWFDSVARALVEGACKSGGGLLATAPDSTLLPRPVAGSGIAGCASSGGADIEGNSIENCEDDLDRWRSLLAAGRFVALAVLSARPLPLSFSLVVCKYLLRRPVVMDDVRRLDPDFFRGRVEAVLRPGGAAELAAALGEEDHLCFMSAATEWLPEPEELLPGGAAMTVTEENKAKYLQLLCEAFLCGGIRREIQCLLQGFWDLLPLELLQEHGVGPRELSLLISGVRHLDVEEWRRCSDSARGDYEGSGQVHRWFWDVVRDEFDEEQRCLLLHFVTGSSRLPPGGFVELCPPFSIEVASSWSPDHLPYAHTCINRLVLHRYTSRD
eukprot:CAMPEP_0180641182 /NCGR_PEP_ID=MMETSP1037_2-20121125/46320_1 /TAXON_ID=632150 /ORGANISM="Azadinium spinosum, Strain 3D9" /LENGTH=824 /DNA_ID=CAMNT_0022663957 /DNA_START=23 /DNA_END=2494 /DNA_ORIENTATION=-